MEVTPEQFEELMTLARGNRAMLEQQGRTLDKMQTTLVGNGSSESVVARLLLVEERQKEAALERKNMGTDIIKMNTCVDRIDKEGVNESHRINQLEKGQVEILTSIGGLGEKVGAVTEIVNNWKQRGIGFSLGMAAAAGGGFALVVKFAESLFT